MGAGKLRAITEILLSSNATVVTVRKGHVHSIFYGTGKLGDLIMVATILKKLSNELADDIDEQATENGELHTALELRKAIDGLED